MNRPAGRTFAALATLSLAVILCQAALAAEGKNGARRPFRATQERTSDVRIDRYDAPTTIVRERTELKKSAVFFADPQPVDKKAIVLFEAYSVSSATSTPRWRCIAIDDVAECLGAPVEIKYLANDEKIVLVTTLKPRNAPETIALTDQIGGERKKDVIAATHE
jgi:hypothetical protein